MKRRINIPSPVTLVQLDGTPVLLDGKPVELTIAQFVCERTCDNAFVGNEPERRFSMDDILAATRVCARFESASAHVDLEEADYERLLRATRSPHGGYHPAGARSVVPFMMAIVGANVIDA
jgi:hypothetical protein